MTPWRRHPAGPRATALLVVAAVALGGCADAPLPEPRPQTDAEAVPVVGPGQLDAVLEGVVGGLGAADAALDPALLAPRVTGPAVELRSAGYAVRRALPGKGVVTSVGAERLLDVVPTEQQWPRTVMTVTRDGGGDALPELVLLTQAGPRDPFAMTAHASLLPGASVPPVAPAGDELPVPPTDEAGALALAPRDAVARYADVLTNGPASQFAAGFAPDAFSTQVLAEQQTEQQDGAVRCPGCLTYTVAHAARADNVWALGTADGGAIVMGVLDTTRSVAVAAAGVRLPIVDDFAVLSGKTEAVTGASFTSVEVVAFAVPPAGSADPVRVLASERALVAVAAT